MMTKIMSIYCKKLKQSNEHSMATQAIVSLTKLLIKYNKLMIQYN